MQSAIFLDRDGVIIENRDDYVRRWEQVVFFNQALLGLARLSTLPYKLIIITNQSAIGRGLISFESAQAINQKVIDRIESAGGRIDAIYMCPHAPEEQCACRKPSPGLILQAANDLRLDLGDSILIGDAVTDLEAGRNAGIMDLFLVETGRGKHQVGSVEGKEDPFFEIFPDLYSLSTFLTDKKLIE